MEPEELKNEVVRLNQEVVRLRIEITKTKKNFTVPKSQLRKTLVDTINELHFILERIEAIKESI